MKRRMLIGFCSLLLMMTVFMMPVCAEEEKIPEGEIIETEKPEMEDAAEEVKLQISDLSGFRLTIKGGTKFTYTGKAITPAVTKVVFTDKEGKKVETAKVKVEKYLENIKFGKADVVISIEGYEGTTTIKDVYEIVLGNVSAMKATPLKYNKTKLSWDKIAGADGYKVYRSTSKSSGFKRIKTIEKGSTVSYNDASVKIGKTYYYKVRAYRVVNGKKVYSAYTKAIKQKAQVAKVGIHSAKRKSYNAIQIKWDKVSDASRYAVYRSTSKKGTYKRIGTVKKNSTVTYTDKTCVCGKTYYYKVAAYRKEDGKNYYGSKSDYISAKATPNKVTFTDKTMSGEKHATLYWEKSSGADGYTIYRSTKKSSGYKVIKHIKKASTLSWKSTGLKADQVYYYKVRPYAEVKGKKVYGTYSSAFKKELLSVKFEEIREYTKVQYRSGGYTPSGWDCSGFTQWAMRYLYGVEIEKYSGSQAIGGKSVNKSNQSKWKPGDILVYSSGGRVNHVGLYLGNGEMMHALNTKHDTVIHDVDYYEKWDRKNNLKCVRRYF